MVRDTWESQMERIQMGANAEDMEGENSNRERISLDGMVVLWQREVTTLRRKTLGI
jgi:hypothetical protein